MVDANLEFRYVRVVYCAWLELVKATKKRKSPVVWMYDYLQCSPTGVVGFADVI